MNNVIVEAKILSLRLLQWMYTNMRLAVVLLQVSPLSRGEYVPFLWLSLAQTVDLQDPQPSFSISRLLSSSVISSAKHLH